MALTTGQWNALGSAGAGLIEGVFNLGATALQNKYNKKMQAQQNEYNLEMWNKQNEYNSPEAQMQRYQDAGLSPQLIYGQGSNGNATSAPEKNAPVQDMAGYFNKFGAALNSANAVIQLSKNIEDLKQNQIKTWLDSVMSKDYVSKTFARMRLGGLVPQDGNSATLLKFRDPGDPYPYENGYLTSYYMKELDSQLNKTIGSGKYWSFRGRLADHGLSEKDHFMWRFLTSNAPETMSGIFDTITSLDSIIGDGVNGLRRFLGL